MLIIPSINTPKLNKNSGLVICHRLKNKKKKKSWYHVEVIIPFHICWTIQRGMKSITSRLRCGRGMFGLSVQGKKWEWERDSAACLSVAGSTVSRLVNPVLCVLGSFHRGSDFSSQLFKSHRLLRAWALEQVKCFAGVVASSNKPEVHYPSRIH